MATYYKAGLPSDVTLAQLLDVYRDEGIMIVGISDIGEPRRHVLEGGNWIYTPDRASVGFVRLFCGEHSAYIPRSAAAQDLIARIGGANKAVSRSEEHVEMRADSRAASGDRLSSTTLAAK